jgi:hypothetical protein
VEQAKHHELLLLIAIRNNSKIPIDEFYKLFDDNWNVFSYKLKELEMKGLFMISALEHLPGSYKYELTTQGSLRITELLHERSNAIDLNLAYLRNKSNASRVPGLSILRRIAGFFTYSRKVEITVPGKNNVMRTY